MSDVDANIDNHDPAFVMGLLWSAIAIAGPAAFFGAGIYPTLMLGAIVGATVRLGTDMGILFFGTKQLNDPVTAVMVAVQLGTLIGGAILWYVGNIFGAGVVGIILLTYLVGIVLSRLYADPQADTESSDSEWKYELDDL